jgi:hypothetical protein
MPFAAATVPSASLSVVGQPGLASAAALLLIAAALCVNVLACRMCCGRHTPGVHRARRTRQGRRCVLDSDEIDETGETGASDSSDDVPGFEKREMTSSRGAQLPARAKRKVKSEPRPRCEPAGEGDAQTLNVSHVYLE